MKIDFNNMETIVHPHFKGGEKEMLAKMYFDGSNRIMHGCLPPGATIGLHNHETSSEAMYITSGVGHAIYDGETVNLVAGDVHYCPKGHSHTLINDGDSDLTFFAVIPQQG